MLQIHYLAEQPDWVEELASWTYQEWGHFDPTNSLQQSITRFRDRLNRKKLPLTFVATMEDRPVGCISLKHDGMSIRPQFSPWIGSMFVLSTRRRQGIGSALLVRAIIEAKTLGFEKLYLWTEKAFDFYGLHGFITIERIKYLSQDARLMVKQLNA